MNKHESSLAVSLIAGILATLGVYNTDREGIMLFLVFWIIVIPATISSLMLKTQQPTEISKIIKYCDTTTFIFYILATIVYSIVQYSPGYFNLLYGNFDTFLKIITPILILVPTIQIIIQLYSKRK